MTRLGPIISNHGKVVSLDRYRFEREQARIRFLAEIERELKSERRAMAAADEISWRCPSDTEVPFGEGA